MSPSVQVTRVSLMGRTLPLECRRLVASPPSDSQSWEITPRNSEDFNSLCCSLVSPKLPSSILTPHTFPETEHEPQGHVCKPHMCVCAHHTHVHTHLRG